MATFNDTKKFHIDKYMIFSGLWFNSMEDYLPPDSDAEMLYEVKEPNKWKHHFVVFWCLFSSLVVLLPTFIRWVVCWLWSGNEAVYWMQDFASILGGSKYYHLPLLTLWAMLSVVVMVQWWRLQYSGDMLTLLKPFIAIHYPERAEKLG